MLGEWAETAESALRDKLTVARNFSAEAPLATKLARR